jgi:multicomponent K+:H+ antiporter subunit F
MNAHTILVWALTASHVMLGLALLSAMSRLFRGPRAQDRILGLDTMYTNAVLLLLTFGIRFGSTFFFDTALIIALLGFTSTAALAKFLIRGEVIE